MVCYRVYAATAFLSACLLFTIQLIFAKTVLPLLGGSAAVWTTCMLFLQAVLLASYAYAHALTSRLGLPGQVATHGGLIGPSLLALPVEIPGGWASRNPVARRYLPRDLPHSS